MPRVHDVTIRFEEPSYREAPAFDYDSGRMGSPEHLEYLHALAASDFSEESK